MSDADANTLEAETAASTNTAELRHRSGVTRGKLLRNRVEDSRSVNKIEMMKQQSRHKGAAQQTHRVSRREILVQVETFGGRHAEQRFTQVSYDRVNQLRNKDVVRFYIPMRYVLVL